MLLSLIAAMNAAQAMVLCVGCDGHVAIEPAGHDHCADGMHLCESDAAAHDTYVAPDAGRESCHGCTDIPMVEEISSDPSASTTSKSVSAGMLLLSSPSHSSSDDAAAQARLEFHMSDSLQIAPLSSIILQV